MFIKKQYFKQIKNLLLAIQVFVLSFYSHSVSADFQDLNSQKIYFQKSNSDEKNAFKFSVKTAPLIASDGNESHIEVDTYRINSLMDLNLAREELADSVCQKQNIKNPFVLEVGPNTQSYSEINCNTQDDSIELENSIFTKYYTYLKPSQSQSDRSIKFDNLTLTITRFIMNTTTVTVGLVIGKDVPIERALVVGILAGSVSGGFQWFNEGYNKWLKNSMLLINAAKKMNLITESSEGQINKVEKSLIEFEKLGKSYTTEVLFLGVCQMTMWMLGIPITENIFSTAAKSTLTQGTFNIGILNTTLEIEKNHPHLAGKTPTFRFVGSFFASGLSVVGAIGAMAGIPFANLSFVVLTMGTVVFYVFGPRLVRLKPIEEILRNWRPRSTSVGLKVKCSALFN